MEQHDIDTFVALAVAQYGRQHEYTQVENFKAHPWVEAAMRYAYNKGFDDGELAEKEARERWEMHVDHEDDIPF